MRDRIRLGVSILFAVVIALTASTSASADPGGGKGKPGPIRPAAATYDPGSYPSSTATSGTAFSCVNESRDPHNSTHVPGTVNAEGYTSCTAPAATTLSAELDKEFAWLWWWPLDNQSSSGYGTVSVFVNANCQGNLNYRIKTQHTTAGTVQGTVTTANTKFVQCQ